MTVNERVPLAQPTRYDEVRRVLGRTPVEFGSAGELAELMARLPAGTPVRVADRVRVDPCLDEGVTESRVATAAIAVARIEAGTSREPGEDQTDRVVPEVAEVLLGTYIVAEDKPVPAHTVAYGAYERAFEALHAGEVGTVLEMLRELVREAGYLLTGEFDSGVPDGISDDDLRGQACVEGGRLVQAALRIDALRKRLGDV
ncbi:hypothetical protein [Polymorphospora rubra]|uniref:Uncharacterized protein n=1 Tax=Polymorphospora rubra TaxID=338584 RepID=A0A810MWY4_9ACTN|nr:hypothetical protein Prubr_27420 [Polymorphospora rubra]